MPKNGALMIFIFESAIHDPDDMGEASATMLAFAKSTSLQQCQNLVFIIAAAVIAIALTG